MLPTFTYIRPQNLKQALTNLGMADTRPLAGGTDLLGCLHDGVFTARNIVSLGSIEELHGINEVADGSLRIGSLTTVSEITSHPVIGQRYPVLAQAASEVASPQLRNQGTIGGNICQKPRCWYYRGEFHCLRKGGDTCYSVRGENQYHCILGGDMCYIVHPSDIAPALVALGAKAVVTGPTSQREVNVENFFVLPAQNVHKEMVVEPGDIVTEFILPPPEDGHCSSYRKVRERQSWDFALAGVALVLTLRNSKVKQARIVLSGAAPIPWRSREAEKIIIGRSLDRTTAVRAAEAAMRNAEPLEHNSYKVQLFKGIIEESLVQLVAG